DFGGTVKTLESYEEGGEPERGGRGRETSIAAQQRGWKVTTIHEHMPLRSSGQCSPVLQQERVDMVGFRIRIVLEHETQR
ncbi:hypothetical protein IRJ41_014252, partial [Triplophysa rosa]